MFSFPILLLKIIKSFFIKIVYTILGFFFFNFFTKRIHASDNFCFSQKKTNKNIYIFLLVFLQFDAIIKKRKIYKLQ